MGTRKHQSPESTVRDQVEDPEKEFSAGPLKIRAF